MTYSNKQMKLLGKVKKFFDESILLYNVDNGNSEDAFIKISVKDQLLYIYDDGDAEIHGPPHDIHFEIYDFDNYDQLNDSFLDKLKRRLRSK